jgi:hypothetical protein
LIGLKEYRIKTYDEATQVIKELGILPLATLVPHYPSLDSMTLKENWHTDSEFDPWLWRAMFPAEGTAAYGKFLKKKSVLISKEVLPLVSAILGSKESIEKRYSDGLVSREALELYKLIREEEGIDTRVLREKAGMKDKEKKKVFDQALVELQGSMDIVVAGTKEKTNDVGEINGWSSSSYETMDHWSTMNNVSKVPSLIEAKSTLKNHLEKVSNPEAMKAFYKMFKF